jgi:Uma2 family endonuclease
MTIQARPEPLTADEFIAWALEQPRGRWELVRGEVVAMAPERIGPARAKLAAVNALAASIRTGGLPCEAIVDGVAVRIDEATVYEPDALVRCGDPLPGDAVAVLDPVIVVEVLSPSSRAIDSGVKLTDYFRLPSLRHYLVVNPTARLLTHHRRDEGGDIVTRILGEGTLLLDPPGLRLAVTDLLPRS